jgi:hypothetical protein
MVGGLRLVLGGRDRLGEVLSISAAHPSRTGLLQSIKVGEMLSAFAVVMSITWDRSQPTANVDQIGLSEPANRLRLLKP